MITISPFEVAIYAAILGALSSLKSLRYLWENTTSVTGFIVTLVQYCGLCCAGGAGLGSIFYIIVTSIQTELLFLLATLVIAGFTARSVAAWFVTPHEPAL